MEPSSPSRVRLLERVQHALSNSAAAQAARGRVRLQVLFSVPRQARELYPYAHVDALDASKTARSHSIEAYVEQVFMTASYAEEGADGQERLTYALECFLYTLPKQRAAVLYVSKLDSSGWGPRLAPRHLQPFLTQQSRDASSSAAAPLQASTSITRVITEAFLRHFACLDHWAADDRLPRVEHLSLHILARAQGAYLFPSSNENATKHILTDGQLIKWWRSVVSSVVARAKDNHLDARPFYIIPGYDRLESHQLLPLLSGDSEWVYGHPFSRKGAGLSENETLPPLPLAGPTFGGPSVGNGLTAVPLLSANHIATLLPHFPDDPKSRFIAELARDAHEHASAFPAKRRADGVSQEARRSTPLRRSATPSTPPPSSSRRAGSRSGTSSPSPVKLTSSQRQSMRERLALDQVSADEFWARMAFRQECCSGNAVGVFVALFTRRHASDTMNGAASTGTEMVRSVSGSGNTGRSMPGQPLSLPHTILQDIIFKRLMIDACDWSKADESAELTRSWEQAIGQAIQRKGNLKLVLGEQRGEAEATGKAREVGKGIVWTAVELHGPTRAELAEAQRRWEEQGGEVKHASTDLQSVAAQQPVNLLSVKRKKRM